MKRMMSALTADIRFQFRQGFYLIYLILTVVYIVIIYQVGPKAALILVPVIIYIDPSMVGFMFTGGLVMLERQQGIIGYLGITPLSTIGYIIAKILSMALLALVAAFSIAIASGLVFNPLLLAFGVIIVSIFNSLLGFTASVGSRSMNDYFIRMIPFMFIIIIPTLGFIDMEWFVPLRYMPGFAGVRLIMGCFIEDFANSFLIDASITAAWCLALLFPVVRYFDRKMIRR